MFSLFFDEILFFFLSFGFHFPRSARRRCFYVMNNFMMPFEKLSNCSFSFAKAAFLDGWTVCDELASIKQLEKEICDSFLPPFHPDWRKAIILLKRVIECTRYSRWKLIETHSLLHNNKFSIHRKFSFYWAQQFFSVTLCFDRNFSLHTR